MNLRAIQVQLACFVLVILAGGAFAGTGQAPPDPQLGTAEAVVSRLYELVTWGPGETPDWAKVKELFIDRAVIVLRTGRDETRVLDTDSFVQLFIDDIAKYQLDQRGFQERIVRTKPTLFGDIAHFFVVYEASIPGGERPPQQGLDSFQLIRKERRWWIVSVTNEIPRPDLPLPEELRQ